MLLDVCHSGSLIVKTKARRFVVGYTTMPSTVSRVYLGATFASQTKIRNGRNSLRLSCSERLCQWVKFGCLTIRGSISAGSIPVTLAPWSSSHWQAPPGLEPISTIFSPGRICRLPQAKASAIFI